MSESGKFNPNEHITNLKGKDYLEVKWRLAWFRSEHPAGSVQTEIVSKEPIIVKAVVFNGDGAVMATGHGSANAGGRNVVWSGREFEKAETAAIGRALAHAGYGTQFTGEDEDDNPVDSPVERKPQPRQQQDALKQEAANLGATVTDIEDAPKVRREVACASVRVQNYTQKVDGKQVAKKRVVYACADGIYASAFTRDHARQAGYNVDEWTEINKPYDLTPTAIVTVEQDGEYWNVISVRKAISEKAG